MAHVDKKQSMRSIRFIWKHKLVHRLLNHWRRYGILQCRKRVLTAKVTIDEMHSFYDFAFCYRTCIVVLMIKQSS